MAHMQSGTGRVREHVQHIILRFFRMIVGFEGLVLLPVFLPLPLDFPEIVTHNSSMFVRLKISGEKELRN
jgi:hypothetical protein